MLLESQKDVNHQASQLIDTLFSMDADGDGNVTLEEFQVRACSAPPDCDVVATMGERAT